MLRSLLLLPLLAASACRGGGPTPPVACDGDPRVGAGCGPCGLDHVVCRDGVLGCDGATDCGYGRECESSADCESGDCTAGRCAPAGMTFIPAGVFAMGSPPGETGRVEGETLHPVRITRHYFMDIHETTQAEWSALFPNSPTFFVSCGEECPVERVRWVEALAYANARSEREGLEPCYDLSRCTGTVGVNFTCTPPLTFSLECGGYRLPTEGEWERAYRALTTTAYYNGNPETGLTCDQPLLREIARFCGNCSVTEGETFDCSLNGARPDQPTDCAPSPVMSYAPNAWGLYDMAGNVAEFTWDTRESYPEFAEDPTGPETPGMIVIRGSDICGHMARLRGADRKNTSWHQREPLFGMRLVRTYRPALPGETVGEDLCNNGCGGCRPFAPGAGTPCGACATGEYVCEGFDSASCTDGPTDCSYGSQCSDTQPCSVGHCSQGHCVPDDWEYIPAGAFAMGSPLSEPGRREDELLHDVRLTRPFMAMSHEVTQRQWRQLEANEPSYFRGCGDDCPVDQVAWVDALDFANAMSATQDLDECYDLSECHGHPGVDFECPVIDVSPDCNGYRLPTEAEWEYAYRAGTSTAFYHQQITSSPGCDQPGLDDIAQYCGNCSVTYDGTFDCSRFSGPPDCGVRPVKSFAPNTWGLFDMAGNASELVWDELAAYPRAATDPSGPVPTGLPNVVRGGSICSQATRARAASRQGVSRFARTAGMGFRLVRSLRPDGTTGTTCDNGCGGCTPIVPAPGLPCGPCGADAFECASIVDTRCNGSTTSCTLGASCTSDAGCPTGACSNGRCVTAGFVYVPPGTYRMGSPPSEVYRDADETPRSVTLSHGLMVSADEVTQAQWLGLMGSEPSPFGECGPDCPVDNVTWLDALAYANALSDTQGLEHCYDLTGCTGIPGSTFDCPMSLSFSPTCAGYRLPTEAEWEYAYRAGSTTALYNGEPPNGLACSQPLLDEIAQYCGNCAVPYDGGFDCTPFGGAANCGPVPVRSFSPNAWGIHDMSGNVAELVWDVYAPYMDTLDPTGPPHMAESVVARGGGFCQNLARMRGADRVTIARSLRRMGIGFRVVRTMQ